MGSELEQEKVRKGTIYHAPTEADSCQYGQSNG